MSKIPFSEFSEQFRGAVIAGKKIILKSMVIPVKDITVDYCAFCITNFKLVFENTRNRERKVVFEILPDAVRHEDKIVLPEEGVYEIYIIKEDGIFAQYNVTIRS